MDAKDTAHPRLRSWRLQKPSPRAGAPDPGDFSKTEQGLNEAAGRVRGLWISYLLLSTYLVISVGSVSHRMLFLETPIRLPVLNVDLPLNGFFLVAPLIYVIFHVYLLLQMSLLATRAREYNDALAAFAFAGQQEDTIRERIDTFIIVQFIAGPGRRDFSGLTAALAAIAWATMTVLPVALLVFTQLRYLPYHHDWITWEHRLLIIADIAALWWLWGRISGGKAIVVGFREVGAVLSLAASILVVFFSVLIATYPGEAMRRFAGEDPFIAWLFEGPVDDIKGGTAGWLANRIIVSDQSFVDDGKLAELEKLENEDGVRQPEPGQFRVLNAFRGRDLRGAVLDRTDLRRSDFTGADLKGASFAAARLDRSNFGCADTRRMVGSDDRSNAERNADIDCTDLAGATFDNADMTQVAIKGIQSLSGDDEVAISRPDLTGSSLKFARLRGAALDWSRLQGASFLGAQLQGASLKLTRLQGASLELAELQGAWLDYAHLHGASLYWAKLQGASFREAHLQGVSLHAARLQAASLFKAQLQGATLERSDLRGASLVGAQLWRTAGYHRDEAETLRLAGAQAGRKWWNPSTGRLEDLDEDGWQQLANLSTAGISVPAIKEKVLKQLSGLSGDEEPDGIVSHSQLYEMRQSYSAERHARMISDIACEADGAPHVVRRLLDMATIKNGIIDLAHDQSSVIATHVLNAIDTGHCPGADEIGDAAKAMLHQLAPDWTSPKGTGGETSEVAGR